MVFHWRLHPPREADFKVSHLCYAVHTYAQCQVVVKLPGSFRLTVGNRHLHRYCIFTELFPETVPQTLCHSCASEFHTRFARNMMPIYELVRMMRMNTNPRLS